MPERKSKKSVSLLTGIFLFFNLLAVLLLLVAYLSFYISPSRFVYLAFASLAYPFILAANLLFILFWIFIRFKYALISVFFVAIGWNHVMRLVEFNPSHEIPEGGKPIKLLTYNIQNFVKENVSNTKYITNSDYQSKITSFTIKQHADIICMQELLYDKKDFAVFAKQLADKFGCPYIFHNNYYQETVKKRLDGIVTFSKYLIINSGTLSLEDKTFALFTDLLIYGDTIRLYNIHLASIHFKRNEYNFIQDMASRQEQQEFSENSKKVITKLKKAFIKRGNQSELLEQHIKTSPYPVIICGDFNDTPSSYAYHMLSKGRKDSFVESGRGFGITYAGENFPAFRIDFILHDANFEAFEFIRHKVRYSDHYPVTCILVKSRTPKN